MEPTPPQAPVTRRRGWFPHPGRSRLDLLRVALPALSALITGVSLPLIGYLVMDFPGPGEMALFAVTGAAVGFISAAVGLALVTRLIVRPLVQLSGILASGSGSPDTRPTVDSQDVLGDLSRGLSSHLDRLLPVFKKIMGSTEMVVASTNQVSSVTEDIAHKADESAAKVGQVATSAEEMSATVLEVARNAQDAALAADEAKKTAMHGSEVVSETVTRMQQISSVVMESAQTIRRLGEKSEQIGKVVQVIDDIADQTNLLALNAAIEAARAGEQGRGFAVVADEVRKLAERTTRATKEIAETIRTIQQETSGAVDAMRRGVEKVEEGSTFAARAGEALKNILTGVEKVADMIGQIAASAEEQSAATEEISSNIGAISSLSKVTASGISEVSQAADELKKLTGELMGLVATLKV
ncbi:MAG: hypothetical protein HYY13_04470 [Nitrospirae bacterium]|nr:hypothetical protein [Nitrospirota bacterium]